MNTTELRRDERGIVVAWLVRLVVGLALLGVVLFDAGAIVVNFFTLDGTADEVALEVAADLATGGTAVPNLECTRRLNNTACGVVYDVAREKDVRVVTARFDQEGVFYVELRRTADTLVVGRIGPIEDWAKATASAQADTN
ncbi:MAG TPA: hypothetical protein VHN37_03760 [Actinomycetota bacterium]|nr:hypothetical protein [Actinomycetota bacterium]